MVGRVLVLAVAASLFVGCGGSDSDVTFSSKPDAGHDGGGKGGTGGSGGASGGVGASGGNGGTAGVSGSGGAAGAGGTLGSLCSNSTQCASGSCVDGVCCDTPCTEACSACTAALKGSGSDGTCGPVADGTDPDSECADQGASTCGTDGSCNGNGACRSYSSGTECAPQSCQNGIKTLAKTCDGSGTCQDNGTVTCTPLACQATACASDCLNDAQCKSAEFCDTGSGKCLAKKPNGDACQATKANQCSTGFCSDGVCCDSACTGTCQSCKGSSTGATDGSCKAALAGTDPDGECTADTAQSCGLTGVCDGNGACAKYTAATQCSASSCSGSVFSPVSNCDGNGSCQLQPQQSCSPYVCNASGCKTSCSSLSDCVATFVCVGGACVAPLPNGSPCSNPLQCASASCVDSVCCNASCIGPCQACSAIKKGGGSDGVCGPVAGGTDPDDDCAQQSMQNCGTDGSCNGSGACSYWPATTTCNPASCAGSTFSPADHCNGNGLCVDMGTTACAPYVCDTSGCKISCSANTDCVSGYGCAAGNCKILDGLACSNGAECMSGFCADGVCCNAPCTGVCQACTAAKKGSGADGVCAGIPSGADPDSECADQGPPSCGTTGFCSGAGTCALYPSGTTCSSAVCVGSNYTSTGTCDGTGGCKSSTLICTPYACTLTGCKTSCTSQGDCASGYLCNGGKCVLSDGQPCSTGSQCASGNCVDGFCCNSGCIGLCRACSNAKTGGTNGTCAFISAGTDPDNECSGSLTCSGGGFCN